MRFFSTPYNQFCDSSNPAKADVKVRTGIISRDVREIINDEIYLELTESETVNLLELNCRSVVAELGGGEELKEVEERNARYAEVTLHQHYAKFTSTLHLHYANITPPLRHHYVTITSP